MSARLFELMLKATGYTIVISLASIGIGLLIGILVRAAELSPQPWLRWPAFLFVSFFRGVPLLVQLLLIYNLLPAIGIAVPSVVAALIGLSLCTAVGQRIAFLDHGRVLLNGTPAELFAAPRHPRLTQFLETYLDRGAAMLLKPA